MNEAFLLNLFLDVAVPAVTPWPPVPGVSADLTQGALPWAVPRTSIPLWGQPALWGRGARGTCQTAPSQPWGQAFPLHPTLHDSWPVLPLLTRGVPTTGQSWSSPMVTQ